MQNQFFFNLKAKATDNDETEVSFKKQVVIFADNFLDIKIEAKSVFDEFKEKLKSPLSFEKIQKQDLIMRLEDLVPFNKNLQFKFEFDKNLDDFLQKNNIIDNTISHQFKLKVKILNCGDSDNNVLLTTTVDFSIIGLHNPITVYLEKFKDYFAKMNRKTGLLQAQIREKFDDYINENEPPKNIKIEYEFVNQTTITDYYPDIFVSAIDKSSKTELESIVINNIKAKSMKVEVEAMLKEVLVPNLMNETFNSFDDFKNYIDNKIIPSTKNNLAINNLFIDYETSKIDWKTKVETVEINDLAQITVSFYLKRPSGLKVKNSDVTFTLRIKGLKNKRS